MEIEFKEQNIEIAKDQDEYLTLPAYKAEDHTRTMVTCQYLNLRERIKVLFTGRIWMSEMTFGKSIIPRRLDVNKWEVLNKDYFYPHKTTLWTKIKTWWDKFE